LAAEGITSTQGLAAKSPGQLLRLPGIGKAALAEIRAFLSSRSDHRADAARETKIATIKSILSGYLDPTKAERAACEIAQVL
jgi:DNA repair protein RadC